MGAFGVQFSCLVVLTNQQFEFATCSNGVSASFRQTTPSPWVRDLVELRQRLPAEILLLERVGITSPDEPYAILGDNIGERRIRFALHARMDCFASCLNLEWPRLLARSKHGWCSERLSVDFSRSACVYV